MDFINNYGSSDEEDNTQVENHTKPSSSSSMAVNAAPDTGFDVCFFFLSTRHVHTHFLLTLLFKLNRLAHQVTYIQHLQQLH